MLLQSIADATLAEMQGLKSTIVEMTDRQAALAADRPKTATPSASAVAGGDGVRYARRCVADIVVGVRNFDSELPQAQALLQQVVVATDAVRGLQSPRDP